MKAAILWLMILVAAVSGYAIFKTLEWRGRAQSIPRHLQVDYAKHAREKNLGPREFVLTDQDGNLFTSDELRGKVWVLSFFFKNCAKECLELNRKLAELQQSIPDPDLHFVSVTCNPELDSPQELQTYRQGFRGDPLRWHMLTGDFNYIEEKIAKPVQLTYKRSDHSQFIVVIGRDGLPKDYIGLLPGTDAERTAEMDRAKKKIAELLAEPAPEKQPELKPEATPAEPVNRQSRRAMSPTVAEVAR